VYLRGKIHVVSKPSQPNVSILQGDAMNDDNKVYEAAVIQLEKGNRRNRFKFAAFVTLVFFGVYAIISLVNSILIGILGA
jgi:hypothetical protein